MWIWFGASCIFFLGEYCIWELAKFYMQNAYVAHSLLSVFTLYMCVCISILCFKLCVCERACACVHACAHDWCQQRPEGTGSPRSGATPTVVNSMTCVQGTELFCESNTHSSGLGHLSSLHFYSCDMVTECLSISFSILTLYPNIWGVFPAPPMCYTENRLTRRLIGFM